MTAILQCATPTVADPRMIDWADRQARARVPFPIIDGLPVNPVEPDLPEGQGELRHLGERACADVAVFVTVDGIRWLLLGQRDDGHGWALPGGGLEYGETDLSGGLRELHEEARLRVDPAAPGVSISIAGARYVPDPRAARNAWAVTTLIVVDLGVQANFPATTAGSDLLQVAWFPAGPVPQVEQAIRHRDLAGGLFRSHRGMLTDLLGTGTPGDSASAALSGVR